jgi:hypothetical protein
MATLKLTMPVDDGRYTLMENGEQYEQLWRFRDVEEAKAHLARLNIAEAQLADLWAGQEIELAEGLVWPATASSENAHPIAHPVVLQTPRTEQRHGRR